MSEPHAPDAYVHINSWPYERISLNDIEPMDDYSFDTFLIWLNYCTILHQQRNIRDWFFTY